MPETGWTSSPPPPSASISTTESSGAACATGLGFPSTARHTPAQNATLLLMRTVITRSAAGGIEIALPVTMLSVTPSTLLPSPLLWLPPRRPLAYCLARRLAWATSSFHAGAWMSNCLWCACHQPARWAHQRSGCPNTWPCPPSWCAEKACSQPLSMPLFRDGLRPSGGWDTRWAGWGHHPYHHQHQQGHWESMQALLTPPQLPVTCLAAWQLLYGGTMHPCGSTVSPPYLPLDGVVWTFCIFIVFFLPVV